VLKRESGWRHAALVASLLVIAALTLYPSSESKLPPLLTCLFCGARGVADFIRNILLFVPFGLSLGLLGSRPRRIFLTGFVLSTAIEVAQLLIPGRDSSWSDVVSNSLGAVIGGLLAQTTLRIAAGGHVRHAKLVTLAVVAMPVAVALCTGFLLQPDFPVAREYGQWIPEYGEMPRYGGRIIDTRIGAIAIPDAPLRDGDSVRSLLARGDTLRILFLAGAKPPSLSPVFGITDDHQRQLLLLEATGSDLVYWYRMRATSWHLEQPTLRLRRVTDAVRAGDTVLVLHWRKDAGECVAVMIPSTGARSTRCGFGLRASRGWSLLLYPGWFPPWALRAIDFVWILTLFLPLGFWVTGSVARWGWSCGVALVALGIAPHLNQLRPSPWDTWFAAAVGVLAGLGARRIVLRQLR